MRALSWYILLMAQSWAQVQAAVSHLLQSVRHCFDIRMHTGNTHASAPADTAASNLVNHGGSAQRAAAEHTSAEESRAADAAEVQQLTNASDIATDEESNLDDYTEERWAAVEQDLDNELPFAAGSSEDEEEDRFYFIRTRSALHSRQSSCHVHAEPAATSSLLPAIHTSMPLHAQAGTWRRHVSGAACTEIMLASMTVSNSAQVDGIIDCAW